MKVQIWYSIDCDAEEFNCLDSACEAHLMYLTVAGEHKWLIARGNTFEQAKERVIALFKLLPPSEELDL